MMDAFLNSSPLDPLDDIFGVTMRRAPGETDTYLKDILSADLWEFGRYLAHFNDSARTVIRVLLRRTPHSRVISTGGTLSIQGEERYLTLMPTEETHRLYNFYVMAEACRETAANTSPPPVMDHSSSKAKQALSLVPSRTLFVSGLPSGITNISLLDHFDNNGELLHLNLRNANSASSQAVLEFNHTQAAIMAIEELERMQRAEAKMKHVRPHFVQSNASQRVWVANLPLLSHPHLEDNLRGLLKAMTPFAITVDCQRREAVLGVCSIEKARLCLDILKSTPLTFHGGSVWLEADYCSERLYEYFTRRRMTFASPYERDLICAVEMRLIKESATDENMKRTTNEKSAVKDNLKELMKNGMEAELREELKEEMEEEMGVELREEIKEDMKWELLDELREELKEELKEDLLDELREEIMEEMKWELQDELREELKEELMDELKDELMEELMRKDVKNKEKSSVGEALSGGATDNKREKEVHSTTAAPVDHLSPSNNMPLEEQQRQQYRMFMQQQNQAMLQRQMAQDAQHRQQTNPTLNQSSTQQPQSMPQMIYNNQHAALQQLQQQQMQHMQKMQQWQMQHMQLQQDQKMQQQMPQYPISTPAALFPMIHPQPVEMNRVLMGLQSAATLPTNHMLPKSQGYFPERNPYLSLPVDQQTTTPYAPFTHPYMQHPMQMQQQTMQQPSAAPAALAASFVPSMMRPPLFGSSAPTSVMQQMQQYPMPAPPFGLSAPTNQMQMPTVLQPTSIPSMYAPGGNQSMPLPCSILPQSVQPFYGAATSEQQAEQREDTADMQREENEKEWEEEGSEDEGIEEETAEEDEETEDEVDDEEEDEEEEEDSSMDNEPTNVVDPELDSHLMIHPCKRPQNTEYNGWSTIADYVEAIAAARENLVHEMNAAVHRDHVQMDVQMAEEPARIGELIATDTERDSLEIATFIEQEQSQRTLEKEAEGAEDEDVDEIEGEERVENNLRENERELKIKQKMAEMKGVPFWDRMVAFSVKIEAIEEKMRNLGGRVEQA